MHSLLIRIFLSFWLIIGVTIGLGALSGYYYGERARNAIDNFEFGDTILEASRALETGGRDGLIAWLRHSSRSPGMAVYVLDASRRDLLGRRTPPHLEKFLHRHREHLALRPGATADPSNLRRARPLSQLVGRDGAVYTILFAPPMHPDGLPGIAPVGSLLLLVALLVSGIVSYLLARAISNPVRKLRAATVAVARGNLASRVGASLGPRRDELGLLARDFDSMAEALQNAAAQQTELSRNISHELRSPLARLRVATELARREAGNLSEFERIDEETGKLDRLIGQILSYTRLDAGNRSAAQAVDIADLVQEVADNVNFECRDEGLDGIGVVTGIRGSPMVQGFADALTSAVENVMRNAVHHSPPGGTVRVRVAAGKAERATIEIEDEGPGVADDELPQLFEPFFRTRRSTEDGASSGTGLGLAIARRAIRRNGGTIAAANTAAGGLRVTIELPARTPATD